MAVHVTPGHWKIPTHLYIQKWMHRVSEGTAEPSEVSASALPINKGVLHLQGDTVSVVEMLNLMRCTLYSTVLYMKRIVKEHEGQKLLRKQENHSFAFIWESNHAE